MSRWDSQAICGMRSSEEVARIAALVSFNSLSALR